MRESHKCLGVCVVTIFVHILLLVLYPRPTQNNFDSELDRHDHRGSRQLSVTNTILDLSTISPLQTISYDGKHEKGIFTSMLWNITNAEGDGLQIPGYSDTNRYHLMLDVGLETGSGLMCMLQEANHTDKVLIGLESHPLNFGLSSHNMLKGNPSMKLAKERIQLLPFAMADMDKYVKFNENFAPACGSILETAKNAWWCAWTSNVMHVPALSMNTLLKMVPRNYDHHYLKIDVEGAEELVLLGGSEFVPRFRMISLEMNNDSKKPNRVNEANNDRVDALLKSHGFHHKLCKKKKSHDCHYAKTEGELVEASRLHALAIFFPNTNKMTAQKCQQVYTEQYLDFKV